MSTALSEIQSYFADAVDRGDPQELRALVANWLHNEPRIRSLRKEGGALHWECELTWVDEHGELKAGRIQRFKGTSPLYFCGCFRTQADIADILGVSLPFFEGMIATIEYQGLSDDKKMADLEEKAQRSIQESDAAAAEFSRLSKQLASMSLALAQSGNLYPKIPKPICNVSERDEIPSESGVYFVWDNGDVRYVGQAQSLRSRLTLRHEKLTEHTTLSWRLFPQSELLFAESYYIGICRPPLNFRTPA